MLKDRGTITRNPSAKFGTIKVFYKKKEQTF